MAGRGESEVESYGSREGILQALAVLGGEALPNELREQVIEDTLRGAPEAKSAWTERCMVEDVTKGLDAVGLPVTVVVGDRDQVEHEDILNEVFARFLSQATFRRLSGEDQRMFTGFWVGANPERSSDRICFAMTAGASSLSFLNQNSAQDSAPIMVSRR